MRVVLELGVAVDAAVDPDVARLAGLGEAHGLGDRDRLHREQPSDPIARSEAPQDRDGDAEGDDARGTEEEGATPGS